MRFWTNNWEFLVFGNIRTTLIDIAKYVDIDEYPIHEIGESCSQLVANVHSEIRSVGCAVIKNFVRPSSIPALISEVVAEFDRNASEYIPIEELRVANDLVGTR